MGRELWEETMGRDSWRWAANKQLCLGMKSLLGWSFSWDEISWDEISFGMKFFLVWNLSWFEICLGMESALGCSQAADSGDKFTSLVRTFTITGVFSWGFEVHALGKILNFPSPCVLLNRCWTAARPLIQNRNSLSLQSFQGFFSRISPNVIRNMRWPHPCRAGHPCWIPNPGMSPTLSHPGDFHLLRRCSNPISHF